MTILAVSGGEAFVHRSWEDACDFWFDDNPPDYFVSVEGTSTSWFDGPSIWQEWHDEAATEAAHQRELQQTFNRR